VLIRYAKKAEKELAIINKPDAKRIKEKLELYAQNPEVGDVIHLSGHINLYRLRVGNYRVIFELIDGEVRILHVLFIAHRSEVYKDL